MAGVRSGRRPQWVSRQGRPRPDRPATRPIPIARGANAGRAPLMPTRVAMRSRLERAFEAVLWNSRFVVMLAVLASVVAALGLFWIPSVDVFYSISHVLGYADAAISEEVRRGVRDSAVTHVVELVDGYLLAAFMLIFALGLYELFISDIDEARRSAASS